MMKCRHLVDTFVAIVTLHIHERKTAIHNTFTPLFSRFRRTLYHLG